MRRSLVLLPPYVVYGEWTVAETVTRSFSSSLQPLDE